jgi:hypothetical protein
MAGITQQVPNYIFGISEQPDELKVPGQVRDLKNALPDVTRGLQKRPGSAYVNTLSAQSNSKWFHIYRDESEQYIGQVTSSGSVKVWDVTTGNQLTVTGDQSSYLAFSDSEDVQVLSVNDYTFLTNRKKVTQMSSSKSPAKVNQAFISLKQIKPGTQYALDVSTPGSGVSHTFSRATNIDIYSIPPAWTGTNYPGSDKGDCRFAGRQVFSSTSNVWFEIDSRCVSSPIPTDNEDQNYYDVFTNTAKLLFGGEDQYVGNTHTVTMTNSKESGSWTIQVTDVAPVTARANIALVRPAPTPFEGLGANADSILQGITAPLQAAGFTVKQIGSGLYVTNSTPFVVSAPDETLMTIIQNSADDVSKLPSSCKNGYIVKIANSGEDEDDYYVKFVGDNGDGPGVWEETVAPDLETSFDASTMPVQLVRQSDGSFNLETTDWEDRLVGDNTTNKEPSFVGKTINKMVFFRNRLGILSDENIVLSRPGDFFNFWNKTATTVVPIDPIDLSCSSQTPAVLYEALETNAGLVMFAENQQFLMTTDSDVFSPRTAKINALSTYNYNIRSRPVSLGTSIAFLNNGGNYTRMFEMTTVNRDTEPQLIEQSKLVSKLIPLDYDLIAESKENNFIALASESSNELWIYRYFNTGDKRIQSAWVNWDLAGDVLYHCLMDDVYYAALKFEDDTIILQSIDIRPTDGTQVDSYRIYMDNMVEVPSSSLTYDANTLTTSFTKPSGFPSNDRLSVFTLEDGNNQGRFENVTVVSNTITISGDWTDTGLTLGYLFEMLVEFPTIYPQQKQGESVRSDVRSSLTVHRVKLNLEDAGVYVSTLSRKGKPDYVQLYECREQDGYKANSVAFAQNKDQTIPVYERNTNVSLTLTSSHPSPCTLISMNWEGDYNPRYYKSV